MAGVVFHCLLPAARESGVLYSPEPFLEWSAQAGNLLRQLDVEFVTLNPFLLEMLLRSGLDPAWRVALPAGSRVMDTGGPKGRQVTLERPALLATLSRQLGLHPDHVVGELGMTELSTPRYETTVRARTTFDMPGERRYAGPPWLRSLALSLTDRSVLPPGQTGMLGHLDLANVDSCAFVLTADLGEVDAAGTVALSGRVPHADWRGCGLDAESLILR